MELNRRQFVLLSVSAAAAACCSDVVQSANAPGDATAPSTQPALPPGAVDAGPLSDFKTDDVYDAFRDQGFFVIRRKHRVFAVSSVCTHKGCKVRVQGDLTFLCKCHGSRFDIDGRVTKGPAVRDLPHLAVAETDQQHVLVDPNQHIPPLPG